MVRKNGETSMKTGPSLITLAVALSLTSTAFAQTNPNAASTPSPSPEREAEVVIVTGVLNQSALKDAPIALSVIAPADLARLAPSSAADLLKSVPGVFVNSALGEIRNIVYSRGVSANSVEAASGYYYVSLQEDGLPVSNVTFTNFGPDYFSRPDITLSRIEALRGGSATITGPNAPGGIFNYISRTGSAERVADVRVKLGLEGDGENPYYRTDAFFSGEIGDTGLFYSVGGFYRQGRGARDAGYDLNSGGQIRANLSYDYGSGKVTVYAKYLNDHNGFFEFLPARGFSNPKVVQELGNGASFLPPSGQHSFTPFSGAAARTWDSENLAHATSTALGATIEHRFNADWKVTNSLRVQRNEMTWNSGGVIFPVSIFDPVLSTFLGTFSAPGGTYTFKDRKTGQTAFQFIRASAAGGPILVNNLPNQSILPLGVLSQAALYYEPKVDEILNQFSLTRTFSRGSLTLGSFYGRSDVRSLNQGAGLGVSPLTSRPQLFDVTVTTAQGVVQQVTNPQGFAGVGLRLGASENDMTQTQFSVFAGLDFDVTDKLTLDGGIRFEQIGVKGFNRASAANPNNPVGGLDGNVNTLFDNNIQALGPRVEFDRDLDFVSYSGAARYRWTDSQSTYIRASTGKKAPDLGFYQTIDTIPEITGSPSIAQEVTQIELGYRYDSKNLSVVVNPFLSKLSNVGSAQLFTRADGTTYTPVPLLAKLETLGVEIESRAKVSDILTLQFQATIQDPKSKDFAIWVANAPGEADDTVSRVPDGVADNNPKLTLAATAITKFTPQLELFGTVRYLGDRAANRFNTFELPGFTQVDLGGTWTINNRIRAGFNINNAFNSEGVMSWGPAGGLLASLDRQAFTPARLAADPGQFFNIITVQPRAFFLTLDVSF